MEPDAKDVLQQESQEKSWHRDANVGQDRQGVIGRRALAHRRDHADQDRQH